LTPTPPSTNPSQQTPTNSPLINQSTSPSPALETTNRQVLGDVFIGRLMDDEDSFRRMDFTLSELSSDAPWIKEAAIQAAKRRDRSGNTQAFVDRMRGGGGGGAAAAGSAAAGGFTFGSKAKKAALPPPPKASTPAEEAKARGNAAVGRGDYEAAADEYTAALKLDPGMHVARNNRALVLLKLGRSAEAEADCSAVLEGDAGNVKALLRRATARVALGRGVEAGEDCRRVLELQPQNKEAAELLQAAAGGAAGAVGGGE